MTDDISDAQRDAIQRASDILGEHFDAHVVICSWNTLSSTMEFQNTNGSWSGGIVTAIGLCDLYREKLIRTHLSDAS